MSFYEVIKEYPYEYVKDLIYNADENYIKNANQNLEKWISKAENLKVIDCYDIEEVTDRANDIISSYDKILRTAGEMELK